MKKSVLRQSETEGRGTADTGPWKMGTCSMEMCGSGEKGAGSQDIGQSDTGPLGNGKTDYEAAGHRDMETWDNGIRDLGREATESEGLGEVVKVSLWPGIIKTEQAMRNSAVSDERWTATLKFIIILMYTALYVESRKKYHQWLVSSLCRVHPAQREIWGDVRCRLRLQSGS